MWPQHNIQRTTFGFALLSLLAVAAETPLDAQVEIVDEQFEDIPWNSRYDCPNRQMMTQRN